MRATSSDFRAFAAPRHDGETRARLIELARTLRAERVIRLVLSRRAAWAHVSETVVHAIEHLPSIASSDWQNVDRALSQLACGALDDASLGDAAVRAAVAVATPESPAFEAQLSTPMRLRWRDVITPRARTVAFDPSAPDQLTVTVTGPTPSDHREIIVRSSSSAQLAPHSDFVSVVPAPQIIFGGATTTTLNLLPPWTHDTYSFFAEGYDSSPLETPVLVEQATELGAFMAVAAPEYLAWVQEVASDLVPIESPGRAFKSGTSTLLPGRIAATFPLPPIVQGELLVHEASHLHLALASEIAPLDDGTDAELYYSPARKTMAGRPIDKILLAFHAWANICGFYESCLEKNLDADGWAERSLSMMKKETNELRDGLEKSPALTNHGRALWMPFFE